MLPIPLFLSPLARLPRLCPGRCPIRSAGNAEKVTLIHLQQSALCHPRTAPPLSKCVLSFGEGARRAGGVIRSSFRFQEKNTCPRRG